MKSRRECCSPSPSRGGPGWGWGSVLAAYPILTLSLPLKGRGPYDLIAALGAALVLTNTAQASDFLACTQMLATGFRPIAESREQRFLGQVADYTARCRGGDPAAQFRTGPYVHWPEYWAAGDAA